MEKIITKGNCLSESEFFIIPKVGGHGLFHKGNVNCGIRLYIFKKWRENGQQAADEHGLTT